MKFKRLNDSGFAHHLLLLFVLVLVLGGSFGVFQLIKRAQADTTGSKQVACVLNAPETVAVDQPYTVEVYTTNNTKKDFTPSLQLSQRTFDISGLKLRDSSQTVTALAISAKSTTVNDTRSSGEWALTGAETKAVFTMTDANSAATCSTTVTAQTE